MKAQLFPRWKSLNIDRYNGLSNPDEHVDTFVTQTNLFMNDDQSCVKCFNHVEGCNTPLVYSIAENFVDATLIVCFGA